MAGAPERYDYRLGSLDEGSVPNDPIALLNTWLEDARSAGVLEPTAMCVSTADASGQPSGRFVLLRGADEGGLTFFTNYESRKGRDLAENPKASATFWWALMERQIRIEGVVARTSDAESDAYFDARPAESRIASTASPQSRVVASREELEHLVDALRQSHPAGPHRPHWWGGYRLIPHRIEFWQGRPARLHDRLLFQREDGSWKIERLAP